METAKTTQTRAAEKKLIEILDAIFYSTTSLTHLLVKAHRSGMPGNSGQWAHDLINKTVEESRRTFDAAIAQPENKVAARPVVDL